MKTTHKQEVRSSLQTNDQHRHGHHESTIIVSVSIPADLIALAHNPIVAAKPRLEFPFGVSFLFCELLCKQAKTFGVKEVSFDSNADTIRFIWRRTEAKKTLHLDSKSMANELQRVIPNMLEVFANLVSKALPQIQIMHNALKALEGFDQNEVLLQIETEVEEQMNYNARMEALTQEMQKLENDRKQNVRDRLQMIPEMDRILRLQNAKRDGKSLLDVLSLG